MTNLQRSQLVAGPTGAEIMADAVKAAAAVFKKHGLVRPSIVLNIVWMDEDCGQQCAMGSRVPTKYRSMMRESLLMSAEEAE